MGKYMRKGKGTGEVAVMEVSPGSLGVRTRAKTLALEQDRKLAASARNASSKQQQQISCVVDPFQTCYLELRSRKLEKVVKEIERPARGGHLMREDGLNEDGRIVSIAEEEAVSAGEAECTARSVAAAVDLRIDSEEPHVAVVGSLRSREHSPVRMDNSAVVKPFPIEPALRCLKPGPAEEPLKLGILRADRCGEGDVIRMPVDGEWPLLGSVYPQDEVNCRRSEVETSYENGASTQGILSMRTRCFRGSPVSSSPKDREADECPGSATRTVGNRQDRREANHHRIMNRRYMRTNLFNDAEAIDELFAAPDTTERVEGMRFTERYNYDVVHDLPLKGRYEWVAVEEPCTTTTTMRHLADQQQQALGQHEVESAFSFR